MTTDREARGDLLWWSVRYGSGVLVCRTRLEVAVGEAPGVIRLAIPAVVMIAVVGNALHDAAGIGRRRTPAFRHARAAQSAGTATAAAVAHPA